MDNIINLIYFGEIKKIYYIIAVDTNVLKDLGIIYTGIVITEIFTKNINECGIFRYLFLSFNYLFTELILRFYF